jgi:hypothetical protein
MNCALVWAGGQPHDHGFPVRSALLLSLQHQTWCDFSEADVDHWLCCEKR